MVAPDSEEGADMESTRTGDLYDRPVPGRDGDSRTDGLKLAENESGRP